MSLARALVQDLNWLNCECRHCSKGQEVSLPWEGLHTTLFEHTLCFFYPLSFPRFSKKLVLQTGATVCVAVCGGGGGGEVAVGRRGV